MLRFITSGESHGPGVVASIEGLPAGLEVTTTGIAAELARRRLGYGRGPRMRLEVDELEILGGVRFGRTLGGPVTVLIRNTEWPRWRERMSPDPIGPDAGADIKREVTPRPGHADLAGMQKYATKDARDILERASARETAARTVVGFLSKQLLGTIGIDVFSHVVAIGSARADGERLPTPQDIAAIDTSEVRVFDHGAERAMIAEIEAAKADRDTLGGVVEVLGYGIPPGLGSHVHWDRKLDGQLAGALMSIQAIKAVEIGDGLLQAASRGSAVHDEIEPGDALGYRRRSNLAGGLEGGITNGEVLRVRAAMKPIATVMRPLDSVNVDTRGAEKAFRERSDVCAVPAAGVVAEQMVAYVLANEATRVFGGDTIDDFVSRARTHRERIAAF